jgi:hypothetical protein
MSVIVCGSIQKGAHPAKAGDAKPRVLASFAAAGLVATIEAGSPGCLVEGGPAFFVSGNRTGDTLVKLGIAATVGDQARVWPIDDSPIRIGRNLSNAIQILANKVSAEPHRNPGERCPDPSAR